MARLQLGATIGVRGNDVDRFAALARRLEDAGVEHLWAGEAYTADAVSTLGFLAAVTDRAQIGSAILPLYSRTPTLLAMTAVGLDRLSKGRFVLGIGASGPQVIEGFHGVPYDRPLGRTREIIEICRTVWRRERLEHDGPSYQVPLPAGQGTGLGKALKIIDQPLRPNIPIHVAALGPKNVALAAELAEGWQPLHYWPERAGELWGDALAEGRARRSPDLPPLEVVAGGSLAIGDDVDHLRDAARPMLALYFGGMGARGRNFYNDVLRRYGYEREAAAIQDLYLSGRKKEAAAAVPAELVAALNLVGTERFVRERVEAFAESGVTILNVQPIGPNGLRDVETLAGWLA
ncbi:MAG TPA: LLM class F420-dependent oxidoreductase [Acidimicrobiales bacterium]|nr:LLM class F420-dependent oxidoreductase [Acidimicrobiales bacterium]